MLDKSTKAMVDYLQADEEVQEDYRRVWQVSEEDVM